MVKEMKEQLPRKPDAIFCSVGGGGLLGGVLVGCKEVGWEDGKSSVALQNRETLTDLVPKSQSLP
jgi:L-serine/L-threonine ammonia-lyase